MSQVITPEALAEDSQAKYMKANYVALTGSQMLEVLRVVPSASVVMAHAGRNVTAEAMIEAIKANPLTTIYYTPRKGK